MQLKQKTLKRRSSFDSIRSAVLQNVRLAGRQQKEAIDLEKRIDEPVPAATLTRPWHHRWANRKRGQEERRGRKKGKRTRKKNTFHTRKRLPICEKMAVAAHHVHDSDVWVLFRERGARGTERRKRKRKKKKGQRKCFEWPDAARSETTFAAPLSFLTLWP